MTLYVRQLELGPMENFVYLVGAKDAREVAVIDPAWDMAAIARAAAEDGKVISCGVVSHCHDDHVNAVPDLLDTLDVPIYAQKRELEFSPELRQVGDAMRGVDPGEEIAVGPVKLKLLHTPGHTPGSHCVLCEGALFSGDTVFVNACGRCDFDGGSPEEMFRSISQVLMKLPADTALYPGHDYGDVPVSSIARESANNPYFQYRSVEEFIGYRMRPRR
jgi:hydroxyacylglutathione hydrolase